FKNEAISDQLRDRIRKKITDKGFDRAKVSVGRDGKSIDIELGAFIPANEFVHEGLVLAKSLSRFKASRPIKLRPIPGFELVEGEYRIENASNSEAINAISKLQDEFQGVAFKRSPTLYVFQPSAK